MRKLLLLAGLALLGLAACENWDALGCEAGAPHYCAAAGIDAGFDSGTRDGG